MNYDDLYIWQDKEVRFDVNKSQIALRNGEKVFDTIANVEDTKGNNGDIGTLIFSNLRLIWYCQDNLKINLSVGYDCILSSEVRCTSTKVAGETKAIAIKCKFNNNRFEFVFNAVANNSPQLFNTFNLIFIAYDTSRLYRDIKVKGFLTQDKNLITLPGEKIISKVSSVASVNNDQAVNGTFYMTNVRVVWFSSSLDNFNMSVPWIQIRGIKTKEFSRTGKVINIETGKGNAGNNFYLKFNDNMEGVMKDLEMNYKVYIDNPVLGVDLSGNQNNEKESNSNNSKLASSSGGSKGSTTNIKISSKDNNNPSFSTSSNNLKQNSATNNTINANNTISAINDTTNNMNEFNRLLNSKDEVEIIETNYFNEQSNILYYMTSNQEKKNAITDIVFSNELGLAIERLPDNAKLENLWKIIVN